MVRKEGKQGQTNRERRESESESESESEAEEEREEISYEGKTYYRDQSDDLVYDKLESDEPVGEWDGSCIVFY